MRNKPWEQLQEDVRQVLDVIDGPAKVTVGSGAVKGNGDVISCRLMVECKQRSRKNIVIEQKVWEKIKKEAELLDRQPVIASRNASGNTLVTIDLKTLCFLMTDFYDGEGV